jgi:hypothetical protein
MLDERDQRSLAMRVIEMYDADMQSREDWQTRLDQALELLALKNKPGDDALFEGAASVTYPLIGEACVQYQARAIEEVFPSEGPVKTKIIGKKTQVAQDQAERVAEHMNWQVTVQDQSYFWHTDQMLFYLPLAGSCFKKSYWDPVSGMTLSRLVYPNDFAVPYTATSLQTSQRYTHRIKNSRTELLRLMATGFYQDVDLPEGINANLSSSDGITEVSLEDEGDDRNPSMDTQDEVFEQLEMHGEFLFDFDDQLDGIALPYIVTVQRETLQLLSIRRNWKEGDTEYRKRLWFTHYKYLPGLGFYGFGLLHLIGSIAESATGALRALLDSAAFANMQGGFISSDANIAPGEIRLAPGVYRQVNMTAEEMSKAFYTPPFKEPSPALGQLFETLIDAGRRFASTTEEMVGDAPNTGPVGTTIALIEQGSKVFTGIHRRLHVAQGEEFRLRAQINYEFLPGEYPYEIENENRKVFRSDYDGRVDVIPVSDPNIFSNAQRIAQAQSVLEVSQAAPQLYDIRAVHERFLKAIKVPDYEALLKGDETKRQDPVNENMAIMIGSGARAYPEQDHDAHIAVHTQFMEGLNEEAMPMVAPVMQGHLAEHYALKYYNEMQRQSGGQLPPPSFMSSDEEEIDPQTEIAISQLAAQIPPIQIMPPSEEGPDAEEAEFQAEEARKQRAFEADEERKQRAFQSDQSRKEQQIQAEIERKDREALAEIGREEEAHKREMARNDGEGSGES